MQRLPPSSGVRGQARGAKTTQNFSCSSWRVRSGGCRRHPAKLRQAPQGGYSSGSFGVVPALLLQQNRALSWLGPEQNHLAGRRQQHVDLALMEIGINEKV